MTLQMVGWRGWGQGPALAAGQVANWDSQEGLGSTHVPAGGQAPVTWRLGGGAFREERWDRVLEKGNRAPLPKADPGSTTSPTEGKL